MSEMKKAREWPVKPEGWMIIEEHSEDGSWSGYASSDEPRGNLAWEEAVKVRIVLPADPNRKAQIEAAAIYFSERHFVTAGRLIKSGCFKAGAHWADANPASSGSGEVRDEWDPVRIPRKHLTEEIAKQKAEIARLTREVERLERRKNEKQAYVEALQSELVAEKEKAGKLREHIESQFCNCELGRCLKCEILAETKDT